VDRYFIFAFEKWKKVYFTPKIAAMTGSSLCLLIYLVNLNVLFTFGYQFPLNGTQITQCFASTTIPSTYWMAFWNKV
jgi:hypothetical protein